MKYKTLVMKKIRKNFPECSPAEWRKMVSKLIAQKTAEAMKDRFDFKRNYLNY
jgi:predicted secreted protein